MVLPGSIQLQNKLNVVKKVVTNPTVILATIIVASSVYIAHGIYSMPTTKRA